MTSIAFAFGAPDRLRTACEIVKRHYQAGHKVVVWCRDPARLAAFDKLLWSFEDISFVPHVFAKDALAAQTPVVLTADEGETPHHQWLLNLDDAWPPIYARFEKLIEVVSNDAADREAARNRWRFYQGCGHPIARHDLTRNEMP
ncbi:DNA polymerase III subunit chi [Pigmentiphaga aceris]|uniref:DNA polymerase III subunit chi n=1 Tax=Pigmentiphaga aceris TaxID=1940612 RepID=A0A5C0B1F9_9BURK|nr:DNA polymerase III subunit chi [Pigmentiphaga aceris]QEI07704.1 DNA polymerase III subunit chi [Pigmentiphaga aceris]